MSGTDARNQFQYTAQLLSSGAGMDIFEISLLKSTPHKHSQDARTNKASEIFITDQEQLQDGESNLHVRKRILHSNVFPYQCKF